MGYDYYCSYCGKQLNQNTVLFDMQYLLTRDDTRQFNILKYRMTLDEFQKLLASGTEGEHGYKVCRLTMADIMKVVGNKNNLNDASVAALTLEEIADYMKAGLSAAASAQQAQADEFADAFDDEMEEEEDLSVEEAPYVKPPSITVLENKSKALVDEAFIRDLLTKDLSVLQGLFAEGDVFEIRISPESDIDNEGKPVLEGYSLKSGGVALRIKARVCSECGTRVFDHAGTAKHQAVAFIGSPKAGKTSTILALAHYAMNYMHLGFGSPIWEGNQVIDSVSTIELVDKISQLTEDMKNYKDGIAPKKTPATQRRDAYSVTFRLSNKIQKNRRYLITLIDLPGELCVEDGSVQWTKVQTLFPVALSCDAFVLCFDTQSLSNGEDSPVELVTNVCKWADEFQTMRAKYNKLTTYVPTMVLFTKCEELEDPNAPVPPMKPLLPLDRMYMLKSEKQQIAANQVYNFFCTTFGEYGQLNKAYHAMMRCSPFGYNAPTKDLIDESIKKGQEVTYHAPTPKNIDYLMRWLLSVTGCIPTEASFSRGVKDVPYRLQNFCITRPQLRSQNPGVAADKGHTFVGDVEESMARCALFENPGRFDREYVAKHDMGKFVLGPVQLDDRLHPDTNAN